MSKEEAREYLLSLSYQFGTTGVEYLTDKDGLKMREAVKILERLKPVEEKYEKPGHWIEFYSKKYNFWFTKCSVCGTLAGRKDYLFCPFCGKPMDVNAEEVVEEGE